MSETTIVLVVRVTADEQALRAHLGAVSDDADINELLFHHVAVPIQEPCFDTPATIEVVGVVPENRGE
jgi:hypothetical protein